MKMTDLSGLVPAASDVGAVSLNVTVTEAGGSGCDGVPVDALERSQLHGWSDNSECGDRPVSAQGEVCALLDATDSYSC